MLSKRRTWLTTTSSACCVRSGMSSRRASSTSTAAVSAVIGDRSSWLTSEANRASRSIRVCTASAISLNDPASRSRSGSDSGARRVSRPPEAISSAASATWLSGRSSRRLVARPKSAGQDQRQQRAEGECRQDRGERRLGLGEREGLEVAGVVLGDVDADRDEVRAVDRGVLHRRALGPHGVDEPIGEVADRMAEIGDGSRVGVGSPELSTANPPGSVRSSSSKNTPMSVGVDRQLFADQVGVHERGSASPR